MEHSAPRLITVPFHDGLADVDRGRGPAAILAAAGVSPTESIVAPDPSLPEAARVFAIAARLAGRVREARAAGALPIVVAGDCNSCLGTVAGCAEPGLGVVWFDAHADFDTPGGSRSGSLDAMGLACLTGQGWDALRATVPGHAPVAERDVALLGVRDLEPHQAERLAQSEIRVITGDRWSPEHVAGVLDDLHARVTNVYLHIDLDVLDPSEGTANRYSAPGGLSVPQLLDAIALVTGRFALCAAAITAYDPATDKDGRIAQAALRVLDALEARAGTA